MKVYVGYRRMHLDFEGKPTTCECLVRVRNGHHRRPLRLRLDIRAHSPTGFEWGYGGSGPAQLALALVADCCGHALATPAVYQVVKAKLIAGLPHEGWVLTEAQVRQVVEAAVNQRLQPKESGEGPAGL